MNDRFLEDLKDRTDLVALVGRYAEVKKAGKNYSCKSPFRNEKTPSFSISPDRGLWYDFGASEGGDALRFLEKVENVSFPEAVEMLANINGMEVPQSVGRANPEAKKAKKDLVDLHEAAVVYFEKQLAGHGKAMAYLKNRGMTNAVIAQWRLGYGGDDPAGLTQYLVTNGFSTKQIAEAGVAFEQGNRQMKDRFAGRIMLPIREPKRGDTVAFSGRVFDGGAAVKSQAKYMNSPENPVYIKSKTLFGLDLARKPILDADAVLLVEGNFDVISAHTAGFPHTVATCGTSLTEDHLRMLKRMTKNIVLAFDADLAGKKATLRGIEAAMKAGLNPWVIDMDGGKDLDEIAQKDPDALRQLIAAKMPALEFLCERSAEKVLDGTLESQRKYLRGLFYYLRLSDSPLVRDEILTRAAGHIKKGKNIVEAEFRAYVAKTAAPKPKFVPRTVIAKQSQEEQLVGFLSLHRGLIATFAEQMRPFLAEEAPRRILHQLAENEPLSEADTLTLTSWEMKQGDTAEEPAEAALQAWVNRTRAETEKRQKIEQMLAQFQQGGTLLNETDAS